MAAKKKAPYLGLTRYKGRRDKNEPAIIRRAKRRGAKVEKLASIDLPDLVIGHRGLNLLVEVKNPLNYGKLSKDQEKWHRTWTGQVVVIEYEYEVDQLLDAVDITLEGTTDG